MTRGRIDRLGVAAIFAAALAIRLAVIAGTVGFHTPVVMEPSADSHIHWAIVQNLLHGHGFSFKGRPTAGTPPLYIFFLAAFYAISPDPAVVRVAQALLGAAGCLVMYAIGRRLFNPATGLAAAALLAIYPSAVYVTGLHLTENAFLFLLLLAILQALRVGEHPTPAGALALGLLLGLVALSRAVFVLFLPFVLLWAIAIWGVRRRTGYAVFAVAAAGMVITLLPWTARNYVVLHAVVPVQSNGAAVFWAGNNARADGGLVWATDRTWTEGPSPDDDYYGWRALGVRGTNARYMQSALTWIRTHPQSYARLLTRKVVRLYEFTRTQDGATLRVPYAIEVVHVAVLGLAFVGLMLTARRWRTLAMLLLLIVFTHGTALLFAGSTRYLLSMLPSVVTFAAVAAIGVAHALSAPKPHRAAVEA